MLIYRYQKGKKDGWGIRAYEDNGLDIDNDTHDVSSYTRSRNGKVEHVRAQDRRNPDDIINNNLVYKGEHPYNGTNPIRNASRHDK